jgi:aminoglycoside phosphotransferase (APT) family kinase protein
MVTTGGDGVTLQVPRTFGMGTSEASIVMERCPGVPLDDLIRRSRRDVEADSSVERAAGSAGAWLRRLHEVTRDPDTTLARRAWNDLLADAWRDLTACESRGLSGRTAASVRRRLRDMKQGLPAAVRTVGCHGDFSPGNVFVAPSALSVIDFEGFHDGLPWEDPAYFLVHLELYFARLGHRARFERLQAAFLEHLDTPMEPVAYELCRTVAALKALARLSGASWRFRPQARMIDRVLAGKSPC